MTNDVWTVHTTYHVEMQMPNPGRTQVLLDDKYENGLLFEGDEGTIFCTRSKGPGKLTDVNLDATAAAAADPNALRASAPALLSPLPAGATRWMPSANHYLNWLEAIQARRDPIAPVDQAARSLETCAAAWISMKLARKLTWDPKTERFPNDPAANALLHRAPRKPEYDILKIKG